MILTVNFILKIMFPDFVAIEALYFTQTHLVGPSSETIILGLNLALPIEDRERNLAKSILARVCTLNVCGYSKLLRSVQWIVHKNTSLKQDSLLV